MQNPSRIRLANYPLEHDKILKPLKIPLTGSAENTMMAEQ